MCLLREVFEEQRVHRALEADVQFGDFTLRERDERHPRELEMLVEGGDVRLIARHAVEGFRDHDIELARLRVGQQLLNGRSEEHTSELQSLMRISYAVFCLKQQTNSNTT